MPAIALGLEYSREQTIFIRNFYSCPCVAYLGMLASKYISEAEKRFEENKAKKKN